MQNGILLNTLNIESKTINNAIIQLGDIDDSGKGRKFLSRFIQPGLVKIEGHGIVLLKKETLDESLSTIIGSPVIIEHEDVTSENADKLRCGVISQAQYNEFDGWYYVEGIIWDEKAQELINKGWSVSCSYDFLAFNDEGGEENNIHYDKEFTNLNFTHLAIVNNPRYERANIVFNSKDENGKWVTIKGNHIFIPDGKTLDEVIKEKGWEDKKQSDIKDNEAVKRGLDEETVKKQIEKLKKDKEYRINKSARLKFTGDFDNEGMPIFQDDKGYKQGYSLTNFFEEINEKPSKNNQSDKDNNKKTYNQYFSDKRTGMSMYDDVLNDEHYANTKQRFPKVITMSPQKYIDTVADGFDKMHLKYDDKPVRVTSEDLVKSRTDEKLNKLREKFGKEQFDMPMIGYEMQKDKSTDMAFQEGIHRAILAREAGLKEIPVAIYSTGRYGEKFTNEELKDNLDKVIKNLNKTNNSKEINKMLLEELKKLIFKVENNKENEMEIDEKVENAQVDKRKLIDEVAGIMKSAGCDDEVIRTAIGKMEKIGYDKSEADGKTDNKKVKNEDDEKDKKDEKHEKDEVKNKCKNEDEEDKKEVKEVKEEVKEDVDNKCKNSKVDTSSFDKINEIYNSVKQISEPSNFVSRQEKLDNAVEYFK